MIVIMLKNYDSVNDIGAIINLLSNLEVLKQRFHGIYHIRIKRDMSWNYCIIKDYCIRWYNIFEHNDIH